MWRSCRAIGFLSGSTTSLEPTPCYLNGLRSLAFRPKCEERNMTTTQIALGANKLGQTPYCCQVVALLAFAQCSIAPGASYLR